jgi:hypothetical protein
MIRQSFAPRSTPFGATVESPMRALDCMVSDVLYWKMDSKSGGRIPDSAKFLDLRYTGTGPGVSVVSDTAARNSTGSAITCSSPAISALDYELNLRGRSFTLCFWFLGALSASPSYGVPVLLSNALVMRAYTSGGPSPPPRFRAEFYSTPSAFEFLEGGTFTAGIWTRVLLRYNHTTKEAKLRYQNNADASATLTGGFEFQDKPNRFQTGFYFLPERAFWLDEVGLWLDYVWDDAEATDNWNGGAGKTWPDVPNV